MPSVAHMIRRRRARRSHQRQQSGRRRVFIVGGTLLLLLLVVLPVGGAATFALSYYAEVAAELPEPRSTIYQDAAIGPSLVLARDETTLLWAVEDPLGDDREWVSLDDLPPYLVAATLRSELDPDFLEANAPPLAFTVQRLIQNELAATPLPPDRTITGRLVRTTLSPPSEVATAAERAREFALIAEVSRLYSPEEILEWHLNTNTYGNDAYGIDAAAQIYLGKRAMDLTVDEAALLAAIPTAPQYNPADDIEAARGRQAALLRELFVNDEITQQQYDTANGVLAPVQTGVAVRPALAPDYAIYAREQAEDILDGLGFDGPRLVARGGLRIITALDMQVYEQATCTLENHLAQLRGEPTVSPDVCVGVGYLARVPGAATPPTDGVLAVVSTRTGELLAVVGDVTATTREPGVVLHPFVYMNGFSSALYTPATMVLDVPGRFPGAAEGLIYTPENPDGIYTGPVNLRDAMGAGLLPPVVGVANTQGLDNILRTARLMGMRGLDTSIFDLSLLERGGDVSVLGATYAYSVFATEGEMRGVPVMNPSRGEPPREPAAVIRIENAEGRVLWDYNDDVTTTPVLQDGLAYLVNDVLADAATRISTLGAGNVLEAPRPTAVVSGLGGDSGAWTIGYTPNLTVGVWVGRDDGTPLQLDPRGITGAAPLWRALSDYSHDRFNFGVDTWPRPDNIVAARVCERSGLRPNDACPERNEIFLENTQPPEVDSYWQRVAVNTQTNQLATANTPVELREERRYFVPPPEAADWWATTQPSAAQLPEQYDTITRPDVVSSTVLLRPALFDYVSGQVEIQGTMDGENLQYYQLAFGQGLNPTAWIDIGGQQSVYTPGESLGTWDTTGLDGLYNLRLTAVMTDNTIDPTIVQVTVDNLPPTVNLVAGTPGQSFTFLAEDTIPLRAVVEDNVAIDRVEFYHNEVFVGTDESFPFGYDHSITRVGEERFRAVVYDAAGNPSEAEIIVEVGRGGT